MAACAALVVAIVVTPRPEAAPEPARVKLPEKPWLSREAAAQLIRDDGGLGPVFAGITVGGSAPSAEARARVEAFARANHVDIAFEGADDELAAIRLEVTYGGCCGYEGVDVLALRMHRPHVGGGCTCGDGVIPNDWAFTTEDHAHVRVRARVSTIGVRWEAALSLPELLERADSLLGRRVADARAAAGDRWIDLQSGHSALLELPYDFRDLDGYCEVPSVAGRDDLGAQLTTDHGQITAVGLLLEREHEPDATVSSLTARWGQPHEDRETGRLTWRLRDRLVTAEPDGHQLTIESKL